MPPHWTFTNMMTGWCTSQSETFKQNCTESCRGLHETRGP